MPSGELQVTAMIIGAYALIGVVVCAVAVVGKRGDGVAVLLLIPLWPFLAPWSRQPGPSEPEDRLVQLARAVRGQLGPSDGERERRAVDGLLVHLLERRRRLGEVTQARKSAPARVQSQLEALAAQLANELEAGESLLEELSAQLLLVRLSGARESAGHATDRVHVEELVANLEALVQEGARAA